MKKTSQTVIVPFPAWDGIYKVEAIASELRRNERCEHLWGMLTPRSIRIEELSPREGYDKILRVCYWYTQGRYAVAVLGGREFWSILSLRLRWREVGGADIRLNKKEVCALGLTAYARAHLHEYYGENLAAATRQLGEFEMASEAVVERLTEPLRLEREREKIRRATVIAELAGVPMSHYESGSGPVEDMAQFAAMYTDHNLPTPKPVEEK